MKKKTRVGGAEEALKKRLPVIRIGASITNFVLYHESLKL
jgi:hypothetical protein